jgi:hypothetical protein
MLTPNQLRLLHPRKRLSAILPPTPKDLAALGLGPEVKGDAKVSRSNIIRHH